MTLEQITSRTYYIPGASNSGVIATGDGGAIVVDTGLNKDAARLLRKALDGAGLTLRAIMSTHHHADHVGGNAYLVRNVPGVQVYAPPVEAALIEHPLLLGEPAYLNYGACAYKALRHRWLLPDPSPVHHMIGTLDAISQGTTQTLTVEGVELAIVPLPGHSVAQIGVAVDGVCFASDGYFDQDVLVKYGVPYAHDIAAQLASLERLAQREDVWFLPAHGKLIPRAELADVLEINRAAIMQASTLVQRALPGDSAAITARVWQMLCEQDTGRAEKVGIPQYAILASAVAAHLTFLEQQGMATVSFAEGRIVWQ